VAKALIWRSRMKKKVKACSGRSDTAPRRWPSPPSPAVEQRILEHVAVAAQLVQRVGPVLLFLLRGQQLAGGRADVGQAGLLRAGGRGEAEGQGEGSGEQGRGGAHGISGGTVPPAEAP
jgi:hypothetical protein